ncbi:MAG: glycosyltransferase family 1 protein [Candidatus Kerfeldbacteria bacterium]
MRIGLDARPIFTSEITGIGTYVLKLVQYLQRHGVRLTLFTNSIDEAPADLDLSQITVVHAPGRRYAWEVRSLPRLIRQHPIDLYHATWNFGIPKTRIPTLLSLFDVIPLVLQEHYATSLSSRIELAVYRHFVGQSIRRATEVVTISNASRSDILRFFPSATSKLNVIPLAADPPATSDDLSKPAEAPDGMYLLYFGGFEKRKNVETLLSIFPEVRRRFPDANLVLIGKKNRYYRDNLQRYEHISGVTFTDYLNRTVLNALIKHATIVLYPSRYEGFGLPVLEAMQFGTPVITSNVSSLTEIARGAAELIDPYSPEQLINAIVKLLSDKQLRQQLGEQGKRRAHDYSWEKTINSTFSIYERMVGKDVWTRK